MKLPLHLKGRLARLNVSLNGIDLIALVERKVDPQKKLSGLFVAELLRIQNIAVVRQEQSRHMMHDAATVWAGQGQYKVMSIHGGGLAY
jgi:hypothetical protein